MSGSDSEKPRPFLVVWRDSSSPSRRWVEHEAVDGYECDVVRSVGFIVSSSEDRVVLASDCSLQMYGGITAIPRECIVAMNCLK